MNSSPARSMTPQRLFRRRVRSDWRFQRRVLRLVVDWVIALYIVVPAGVAAAYQYVTWWAAAPAWSLSLPQGLWLTAVALFLPFGGIRLFVEEADQLFLIERAGWLHVLKTRALAYSTVVLALSALLPAAAVAPLLVHRFGWRASDLAALGIAAIGWRLLSVLTLYRIRMRLGRWIGGLAAVVLFLASIALFALLAIRWADSRPIVGAWAFGLAAVVLSFLHIRACLRRRGSFFAEVAYEQKRKMRFVSLILRQSGAIEAKPALGLSRPLVFRSSGTWFRKRTAENVLAETSVKSFLRSGRKLSVYARFVAFGAAAAAFGPVWLNAAVWAVISGMLVFWCRIHWKERKQHGYFRMFAWSFGEQTAAEQKTLVLLALPGSVLMSLPVVLSLPVWMWLPAIAAAGAVVYMIAALAVLF